MPNANSYVPLTDQEWSVIKRDTGLPDAARGEIDEVIAFFQAPARPRKPWAHEFREARDAIRNAQTVLSQALSALDWLLRSEAPTFMDTARRRAPNGMAPLSAGRPIIERAFTDLSEILDRLPHDGAIPSVTEGRPLGALGIVLSGIDQILIQYTGGGLTQSGKSIAFVNRVCKKAAKSVTDDAVKKHIKAIRRRRRE